MKVFTNYFTQKRGGSNPPGPVRFRATPVSVESWGRDGIVADRCLVSCLRQSIRERVVLNVRAPTLGALQAQSTHALETLR